MPGPRGPVPQWSLEWSKDIHLQRTQSKTINNMHLLVMKADSRSQDQDLLAAAHQREAQAMDLFEEYDHDGNGYMELEEFTHLMKDLGATAQMTPEETEKFVRKQFNSIDRNNDYRLNFKEFVDLYNALMEAMYNNHVSPTDEELTDIAKACGRLYDIDMARLVVDRDLHMNVGVEASSLKTQAALQQKRKLFSVDEDVPKLGWDAFNKFWVLLDNFEDDPSVLEIDEDGVENKEQAEFLANVMSSSPMEYVLNYLMHHGKVKSREAFAKQVKTIWFSSYSTSMQDDTATTAGHHKRKVNNTCGFERAFIGEVSAQNHAHCNWITFYAMERFSKLTYLGYVKPDPSMAAPSNEDSIIQVKFAKELNGKADVEVATLMIGATPAFEMALHTLLFFMEVESVETRFDKYVVDIVCKPQLVKIDPNTSRTRAQSVSTRGKGQKQGSVTKVKCHRYIAESYVSLKGAQ